MPHDRPEKIFYTGKTSMDKSAGTIFPGSGGHFLYSFVLSHSNHPM
jgi:hypothetical protein